MEDFSDVIGFTSSTPTKHQYLQRSGQTNENDQYGLFNTQKPRKSKVKHFMSPTLSAATKAAAVQMVKVLADRNEAFTIINNPVTPRTPILDSRTPIFSGTNGGVEGQPTFDADSSNKKPYDPLTNYLSPRPKFLRYNPNRRRKMFLHGENEAAERKDGFVGGEMSGSVDSQKVVGEETPSEEEERGEDSVLKGDDQEIVEKNEGNDDDEEEMDEEEGSEEESCWSLRGVLKFLLVLGALFLSTLCTCFMNSPDPSPIKEAMWDVRDGFQNFQSNVYEVVARGKFFDSGNQVSDTGLLWLLGKDERNMDDKFVGEEIVEKDDAGEELVASAVGLDQVDELQNEQCEDVYNDALVSNFKVPDPAPGPEMESNGVFRDFQMVDERKGSIDVLRGPDYPIYEGVCDQEMNNTESGSDQMQGLGTEETIEWFQEVPVVLEKEEAIMDPEFKDEPMEIEEQNISQKVTIDEVAGVVMENEKELAEDPMEVGVVKILQLVPLVVFSTLVTALLLGPLYFLRQRKSAKKEDTLLTEAPIAETSVAVAAAEKINLEVFNAEEERKLEKIESSVGPASSFHLGNESPSEDFSRHSQAPIVELLGELVIGEVGSSFKRRKTSDIDESNRISVSTENMMISRSKGSSSQVQGQRSLMEVSKADSSPSFRSFTAENKKIRGKKEESKDEEMSLATSTPVRRSSRIRNRVMSP